MLDFMKRSKINVTEIVFSVNELIDKIVNIEWIMEVGYKSITTFLQKKVLSYYSLGSS